MPDEILTDAAKTLSTSVLGAVLVLFVVLTFFVVRALRQDIKDLQARLDKSEEAHQRTRDSQLDDLRKTHGLASSIDDLRNSLVDSIVRKERI